MGRGVVAIPIACARRRFISMISFDNVLPAFLETGYLPPGIYSVSWSEVVERFGWNPVRRSLIDGLFDALCLLAAAGCESVG
jgi:hypothetical protein